MNRQHIVLQFSARAAQPQLQAADLINPSAQSAHGVIWGDRARLVVRQQLAGEN